MRIDHLHLDGFGHFSQQDVGPFDLPLVVVLGANEAGKSTLLAFIRTLLFGFPRQNSALYYPPLRGGRHGGRLHLTAGDGSAFVVERYRGPRGGDVRVTGPEGAPADGASLPALLGHASADLFQSVFAFSLTELQDTRSLSNDEVNNRIYSAGLGASNLPRALQELESEQKAIFAPRGSRHRIAGVLSELQDVDARLAAMADQAAEYGDLTRRRSEIQRELDDTGSRRAELSARSREMERLVRAWGEWEPLRTVQLKLDDLPQYEGFPEDALSRLNALDDRIRDLVPQLKEAQRQLETAEEAQADDRQTPGERTRPLLPLLPVLLAVLGVAALAAGVVLDGQEVALVVGTLLLATGAAVFVQARQRATIELFERINTERADHRRVIEGLQRRLRALEDEERLLIEQGGAADADDLRRRAVDHAERRELERQQRELQVRLRQLCGPGEDLDGLVETLECSSPDALMEERRAVDAELEAVDLRREELREEQGRVASRIESLASEEESSALRVHRQVLLERLRAHAREWSVLTLARALLERTRRKYEEERQPGVMRHTQGFFKTITGGRYRRVHVPLDAPSEKRSVRVVDGNGTTKGTEELSRGTKEQLYLALRFGLIREFGQHAEPLPVVVDEVLVNFDPGRARRAAEAFASLSETNQVLVFTCHPQTAELFTGAAREVRIIEL